MKRPVFLIVLFSLILGFVSESKAISWEKLLYQLWKSSPTIALVDMTYTVETTTDSQIRLYYDGNVAIIDSDGNLHMETSTNSLTGLYYDGNTAEIRDGSSDNNVNTEKGLIVQSNLHALFEDEWERLRANEMRELRVITSTDSWIKVTNSTTACIQSGVWKTTSTIDNFPADYPDSTAQGSLSNIDGNITKADTDNVRISTGAMSVEQQGVWKTTSTINNFPADYPDSTSQGSLSSIDGKITAIDTGAVALATGTITTNDARYEHKISTGTASRITDDVSPNVVISIVDYYVSGYSFFAKGADCNVQSTLWDGILYVLQDSEFSETVNIPKFSEFQITLGSGATIYYKIRGEK